jgi:hypothetical protein
MSSVFRSKSITLAATSLAAAVFTVALVGTVHTTRVSAQQAPARPAVPAGGFSRAQPDPLNFDDHDGWTQIFDGKSLKDWDGPSDVWHYEDGMIVGESTDANPSGTTNILWRGGMPANFELRCEMKLEGAGANGGIQYRSVSAAPKLRTLTPEQEAAMTPEQKARFQKNQEMLQKHAKWNVEGYQLDFDAGNRYTGQMYEQGTGRGIIAYRGQVVRTETGKKPTMLSTLGTGDELKAFIKPLGEWNQVEIIADGNTLVHIVNGHVMSILVDTDPKFAQAKGLIGFEIEGGGTLKISHRNVWMKPLP